MPTQAKRAVAQRAPKSRPPKSRPPSRLGALPEWNLADLYAGIDDPQVKRDLDRGAAESLAFEEAFKGKLAGLVERSDAGSQLAAAVKRYEALDDLLGRLTSYAGLLHAGDTVDPARAKFYADVQERVTAASTHLLFFTLELNRLDDAKLEAAMQDPALAHYRPWIEDVRKDKPYQLEDRVEQLFHEKSVTGYSAWNRLFDETIASLRFKVGSQSLAIEPTLNLMQDPRAAMRQAASQALAKTFKENLRTFALVTNVLAKDKEISDRWRGFVDVADARHLANRVEPEVVEALVEAVRAAYSAKSACRTGTATRRYPRFRRAPSAGTRRARPCSAPMARSPPTWPRSRSASSATTGSTRRCARAKRPAPSRIRPFPRHTPTCCSITRAGRAT
jgi:oligoendopeptidase F